MEKNELIKKWLNNDLSDEEFERLVNSEAYQKLINTEEFLLMSKIDQGLRQFKAPAFNTELKSENFSPIVPIRQEKRRDVSPWLKVAAIFILASTLLLTLYNYVNQESPTNISAHYKKSIYLPDSSLMTLNSKSSAIFQEDTWDQQRKLQLEGEAYFEVYKGKKFEVLTELGKVAVLGTKFSVNSRDSFFEVVCFEGKVLVNVEESQFILSKGESVRFIEHYSGVSKQTYGDLDSPAWLKGESSFKSVPFKFVLEEFERQFDVSLQVEGVNVEQPFTGRFTHKSREMALKSITIPFNCSYRVNDSQIILFKKETP